MTVDEIFTLLAAHMQEGLLYHDAFARAYNFLGLHGFAKCQFSHYMNETKSYQQLLHYYMTHYHKLLTMSLPALPEIIPATWFKYDTTAVDTNTMQTGVRTLMNKWIEWERKTKQFYSEMYQELYNIKELAAASYLFTLIADVDKELSHAEKKLIKLEQINYDPPTII